MRKTSTLLLILLGIYSLHAQTGGRVGINTTNPNTTLDVTAKKGATDADGLQAPRLTRAELTLKGELIYGANQTGAIVYITDVSTGNNLVGTQREFVDQVGYYFFNGTKWMKTSSGSESNSTPWNDAGTTTRSRNITTDMYRRGAIEMQKGAANNVFSGNEQVLLGYQNTSQYRQAIKSRHDGGASNLNSIDFYTFDTKTQTDPLALPSKQSATIQNGKIGVNGKTNPVATLDLDTSTDNTIADGLIPPRVTGDLLFAKQGAYNANHTGAVCYVTVAAAVANRTGQTVDVDSTGFYYFDGTKWVAFQNTKSPMEVYGGQALIPQHGLLENGNNSSTPDFNNHSNTAYDTAEWIVISKTSRVGNFPQANVQFASKMTIVYEFTGTAFNLNKLYPILTTGNNSSYPDTFNASFVKIENVAGKTRLTVAVTRTDALIWQNNYRPPSSNWFGVFLLNILLVRRTD